MLTRQDTTQINDLGTAWETAQNNEAILRGVTEVNDLPHPATYVAVDAMLYL